MKWYAQTRERETTTYLIGINTINAIQIENLVLNFELKIWMGTWQFWILDGRLGFCKRGWIITGNEHNQAKGKALQRKWFRATSKSAAEQKHHYICISKHWYYYQIYKLYNSAVSSESHTKSIVYTLTYLSTWIK